MIMTIHNDTDKNNTNKLGKTHDRHDNHTRLTMTTTIVSLRFMMMTVTIYSCKLSQ